MQWSLNQNKFWICIISLQVSCHGDFYHCFRGQDFYGNNFYAVSCSVCSLSAPSCIRFQCIGWNWPRGYLGDNWFLVTCWVVLFYFIFFLLKALVLSVGDSIEYTGKFTLHSFLSFPLIPSFKGENLPICFFGRTAVYREGENRVCFDCSNCSACEENNLVP